ncbi:MULTISPECIES: Hsp70 family protein [Pseudanabaena]|uniref:Hsp70 family protein n=1 Tax=Pseudanabaena TaxID=1152 RepID=UPI002479200A|nr:MULTISPECIES: Hsp70 family protein [Pseudanabaena]MEA5485614.1 Hsp70 family protein [Pseudanabaena sp. CCNP1317]WGS70750.1 Hsp70 family protein [Pseudanabaena galeata CCNP1313]
MTVIAIDFGTSNTAIAILASEENCDLGLPKTLLFEEISQGFATAEGQAWLVPSLVYVLESGRGYGEFLFGEQARSQYQLENQSNHQLNQQSKRLFQGFKRDIVASFRSPACEIDGKFYDAEAIAEIFLTELWQRLALKGFQPTQVIFTVPVGAFEGYLNWFSNFAEKLRVSNFQIIDESTAAALGYAITRPNALVLVIDFGGGTLDLSLVRTAPIANNRATQNQVVKAEAIAKSDAYIGGIDIDRWIAEYFLRQLGIARSRIGEPCWQKILAIAEQIKIKLSLVQEVQEDWIDHNKVTHKLKLSQDELMEILEQNQMLEQLREAIDEVLTIGLNRGISKAAIEQILLVGGSCQIVAVQQLIISYFGKSKVKLGKPFEAVAHGALALGQSLKIEDHLRHSYAIRLWEPYLHQYSFYTLFEKGTKYPCQRAEPLILQAAIAGQTEIWLDIGEVADISQAEVTYDNAGRMTSSQLLKQSDFRSLAANSKKSEVDQVCIARLDPSGQLGSDRITVNFEIDDRRVLIATVRDLLTDKVLIDQQAIAKLE